MRNFHYSKYPTDINTVSSVDSYKIMVSKKVSFDKKYFKYLISYKDHEKNK